MIPAFTTIHAAKPRFLGHSHTSHGLAEASASIPDRSAYLPGQHSAGDTPLMLLAALFASFLSSAQTGT